MLGASRVVVVVPAFREELHVGAVVATMPAFVDAIVVVDDGSDDLTSKAAAANGDPRLHLVRHDTRRGVGAAIVTGYKKALRELTEGPDDVVCVMAGDGQMHPDDLALVCAPIVEGNADYVKGDRFSDPGVRGSMGLPRFVGGQVFSLLTSLAIGQRIHDSQCGYTAIARRALEAIPLDELWPGFGYPNDLLGLLAAHGLRIREVLVRAIYGQEKSKLRLHHLPRIFVLIGRAARRRATA